MTVWNELVAAHQRVEASSLGGAPAHEPRAAVLCCSDARVPPSVIFDQPAGTLFVVRIAGNTASPAALASLDYAVDILGVRLLVVLGHTGCGAVQAAASGRCGGHLAPIVESICTIAKARPDLSAEQLVRANVGATISALSLHGGPVGRSVRRGELEIQGAVHDLITGALDPVVPESADVATLRAPRSSISLPSISRVTEPAVEAS